MTTEEQTQGAQGESANDAQGTGTGTQGQDTQAKGGEQTPASFEDWKASLPDHLQGLIEDHTKGLRSALKEERAKAGNFEKQLRDLAKKQEKDSDARKSLEDMADQLNAARQEADFYAAATTAGVRNVRLAYLAAKDAGLVPDDGGQVDFRKLRTAAPEVFAPEPPKKPAPRGNAGDGVGSDPNSTKPAAGMNSFIRTAAGRS